MGITQHLKRTAAAAAVIAAAGAIGAAPAHAAPAAGAPSHPAPAARTTAAATATATAEAPATAPATAPKPLVSTVSPASGPLAGGTRVTVTGKYFAKVAKVVFGSTAGTALKVLSTTKLQVTAPKHAAGTVNVEIVAKAGTSKAVRADQYTYVSPPAVTKLSAAAGPLAGGTRITVTGKNFTHVSKVLFGSTPGTLLKVLSATQLQVTSPKHAAGTQNVRVVTAYGTSSAVTADHFTYVAPPVVNGLSSISGGTAGGETVYVYGASFTSVRKVLFGTVPGTAVKTIAKSELAVTAPAHATGQVDIRVVTAYGTSPVTTADQYTYLVLPVVTAVSPPSGTSDGGTTVTITGTDLSGVTSVLFGFANATSFKVNSATSITATTPSGSGTVDVTVQTPTLASEPGSGDKFSYVAAPAEALTWSTPKRVTGTGNGALTALSCPAANDCVGVDYSGHVFSWNGSTWTAKGLLPTGAANPQITALSCPATTFCVAVGWYHVWTYSGGAWSQASTPTPTVGWESASCPSTTFCFVTGYGGDATRFTGSGWTADTVIDSDTSANGGLAVSCASSAYCLVLDGDGNTLTWHGSSWAKGPSYPDKGNALGGISCVSATFCLSVDNYQSYEIFNGTAWSAAASDGLTGIGGQVSCTSATFCMAVDTTGDSVLYDGGSWVAHSTFNDGQLNTVGIACAAHTCAAGSTLGSLNTFVSGAWTGEQYLDTTGQLNSVSCPTSAFCAGADADGDVVTSDNGTWGKPVRLTGAGPLDSVSCVSASFCLATDLDSQIWEYNGATWSSLPSPSPGNVQNTADLSCVSTTFCVWGGDNSGLAVFNGATWTAPVLPAGGPNYGWASVSCVSATYCLAMGAGYYATYTGGTWSTAVPFAVEAVLGSDQTALLSCATTTFCEAVDSNGGIDTFNGASWTYDPLGGTTMNAVSCATATFCAALSSQGTAYTFDGTQWSSPAPVSFPAGDWPTALTCRTSTACLAGDTLGYVSAGT